MYIEYFTDYFSITPFFLTHKGKDATYFQNFREIFGRGQHFVVTFCQEFFANLIITFTDGFAKVHHWCKTPVV